MLSSYFFKKDFKIDEKFNAKGIQPSSMKVKLNFATENFDKSPRKLIS